MTSLHLGCGPTEKLGDVGVDILPGPAVDVVCDLDVFPWPLPDAAFDRVLAKDILEHLRNIPRVMEELHRVMVPGGVVEIQAPCPGSPDLVTDPTHLRAFGSRSFNYFDPSKRHFQYRYSSARFQVRSVVYDSQGGRLFALTDRLMERFANRWPEAYDDRLSGIYPLRTIRFELVALA